ncbi:MAG TPA: hypothetical protein VFG83_14210 [Kofleriaceae bacterium]|nr:hypothetical protein [Kofleriaceae bacterium]
MMTSRLFLLAVCASLGAGVAGCGDDSNPVVDAPSAIDSAVAADSAPADAPPAIDAGCDDTVCEMACVDTTSDDLNCGGCGMACETPARQCAESACACPDAFIPDIVVPIFETVQTLDEATNTKLALAVISGPAGLNGFTVVYNPATTDTDVAIPLTGPDSFPAVGAAFNISTADQTFEASYVATSGQVTLTEVCDTGISGVVDFVAPDETVLFEELDFANAVLIENGCTFEIATASFSIGSCEPPPDGGTGTPREAGAPALAAAVTHAFVGTGR